MRFEHGANLGAVRAAELANLAAADELDADVFLELYEVEEFDRSVGPDTVASLRALGLALREVFAAAEPRSVVNAMLADVEIRPHVTDHDDRGAHLHYEAPDADPVERVRANTLMGLAVLLCDDHDRIGTCAATGCDRAWVDTSRNARRRFCSSQCANRTHVAAHRARARDGDRARARDGDSAGARDGDGARARDGDRARARDGDRARGPEADRARARDGDSALARDRDRATDRERDRARARAGGRGVAGDGRGPGAVA